MTTDEAIKMFGDYKPFLRADGTVDPSWEKLAMGSFQLPSWIQYNGHPEIRITRVTCHHLLVPHFGAVFLDIWKSGNWPLLRDYGGCYNFRRITGGKGPSLHSWGIAMDLNVADNPRGATPTMPKEIVSVFKDHGFNWGGDWHGERVDGMHFEWGGGVP